MKKGPRRVPCRLSGESGDIDRYNIVGVHTDHIHRIDILNTGVDVVPDLRCRRR